MLESGFYNLDCMAALPEYPDNYFDLAIVDPPYGINITGGGRTASIGGAKPFGSTRGGWCQVGGERAIAPKVYKAFDDSTIPDKKYFDELRRVSKKQIIWGGNYFLDYLPAASCMIVWDKGRRGLAFADCEIAWTNIKEQSRVFTFKWNGMLQGDMLHKEERIHPTQKPVRLYTWLLANFADKSDKILDTHVGSASSLIACERLGYDYVGFEIDTDYYNEAVKRLDEERAQLRWTLLP